MGKYDFGVKKIELTTEGTVRMFKRILNRLERINSATDLKLVSEDVLDLEKAKRNE